MNVCYECYGLLHKLASTVIAHTGAAYSSRPLIIADSCRCSHGCSRNESVMSIIKTRYFIARVEITEVLPISIAVFSVVLSHCSIALMLRLHISSAWPTCLSTTSNATSSAKPTISLLLTSGRQSIPSYMAFRSTDPRCDPCRTLPVTWCLKTLSDGLPVGPGREVSAYNSNAILQ